MLRKNALVHISNHTFHCITVDIELSDESGNIKNLRDPGFQQRYATEFLDEREKLILLKVESKLTDACNESNVKLEIMKLPGIEPWTLDCRSSMLPH